MTLNLKGLTEQEVQKLIDAQAPKPTMQEVFQSQVAKIYDETLEDFIKTEFEQNPVATIKRAEVPDALGYLIQAVIYEYAQRQNNEAWSDNRFGDSRQLLNELKWFVRGVQYAQHLANDADYCDPERLPPEFAKIVENCTL